MYKNEKLEAEYKNKNVKKSWTKSKKKEKQLGAKKIRKKSSK